MATTSSVSEQTGTAGATASALLVSLGPQAPELLSAILGNLAAAFPERSVTIATADALPAEVKFAPQLEIVHAPPPAAGSTGWVMTAVDYLSAYKLAAEHNTAACLLLGPEAQSLAPEVLRTLADGVVVHGADLVTPHYVLGPRDGLVNSAILYPVTRALFGARVRYPLAIDLALSMRMAERLAATAQRHTAGGQDGALMWPVVEAAAASFVVAEVQVGARVLPAPGTTDLNTVLAQVAGSLFAEVDAKAALWQRARMAYPPRNGRPPVNGERAAHGAASTTAEPSDIHPMLDTFRLACANLQEIWSLVLPPNSLLGLKKLSQLPAESFRMPDALWARIVYDFILAWRLRTLNRGHLLGALTPLYLAWVASHLLQTADGAPDYLAPEAHVQAVAAAFEADKPYLVSRWRWPDRFNP